MGTDFFYITVHQSWAHLINTCSCYAFVPVCSVIRRETCFPWWPFSVPKVPALTERGGRSKCVCVCVGGFLLKAGIVVVEGAAGVLDWIWMKTQLWQEVMERMVRGAVCWYHTQCRCPSEWRKNLTRDSGFRINRIKGFALKAHLISPTSLRCTFRPTSALG